MKKRKDNNGRVLKDGESQRKDGVYQYRWTDRLGKRHSIYDKELNKLREKEALLQKDMLNGFDLLDYKTTVYQLMQSTYELKKGTLKKGTLKTYDYILRKLCNSTFGNLKVVEVKSSDVKQWFVNLNKNGLSYATILGFKSLLGLGFKMACEDDVIRKNPLSFKLGNVIHNDKNGKAPLTEQQYSNLLTFVLLDRTFRKYYEEIVFLHETGIRVSEFCGLTIKDFDFVNKEFSVDKQLIKDQNGHYRVETPKSKAGYRTIPLSDEAYQAIRTLINRRPNMNEMMIDGYCGFVLARSNGKPKTSWNIEYYLREITSEYNRLHPNDRLPLVTPHTLRHTFCTEKIKSGMNIKAVQYLMGHNSVETTLNIYTSLNYEDVKAEFTKASSM